MAKTVLAFGETLWDLLPDGMMLGGAPFNFAYRVCGLGDRGLVVSRLGRDELGAQAMERIVALGMDTTFIQWDDRRPTGTVRVRMDVADRPDYFIVPDVAYDHVTLTEELLAAAASADCIGFGTLSQRAPRARRTLEGLLEAAGQSTVKLLDVNLRKQCYTRQTVEGSLEWADVLRCNEDETSAMAELLDLPATGVPDFCQAVLDRWAVTCCLVTLGERGAYALDARGQQAYAPGYQVKLVDTLGAGDAFTAGFIHEYLRGEPLARCLARGNALGAIVAGQKGGTQHVAPADMDRLTAGAPRRVYDERLREYEVL